MTKIFKYEFGRIISGATFWGLAFVTLAFGYQTLKNEIIWGVANTAPFSPWSFGLYISRLMPFICALTLFLITSYSGKSAKELSAITNATPVDKQKYAMIRCAAVASVSLLLTVASSALGLLFNAFIFGVSPSAEMFVIPALFILPWLIFAIGAGWRLASFGSAPVLIMAALILISGYIPLPMWASTTGAAFFSEYPLSLGVLDPPLTIPVFICLGRAAVGALGAVLLIGAKNKR